MTDFSNNPPNPSYGNMKNDQIFCNAVAIGCANPSTNTDNESRLIIKKQGSTNNSRSLIEILDNSGNVLFSLDKDFNLTWTNSSAYSTSSTYSLKFTNQEIAVFGGGTVYNPGIEPNVNLTGYLGTSSKKWYTAYFNNAYGTSFNTISDSRVKENIVDADNTTCMTKIRNLKLRRYTYIEDSEPAKLFGTTTTVTGLVAQEVKTVLPHAISEGTGLLPDGTEVTDFHYLRKSNVYMELVGAVKYLDSLVQTQATTISNLESRIAALESN